jgi:hypothetical protein
MAEGICISAYIDTTYNPRLMRIGIQETSLVDPLGYAGERVFAPAIPARGNRRDYARNLTDFDLWWTQSGKPPQTPAS